MSASFRVNGELNCQTLTSTSSTLTVSQYEQVLSLAPPEAGSSYITTPVSAYTTSTYANCTFAIDDASPASITFSQLALLQAGWSYRFVIASTLTGSKVITFSVSGGTGRILGYVMSNDVNNNHSTDASGTSITLTFATTAHVGDNCTVTFITNSTSSSCLLSVTGVTQTTSASSFCTIAAT